MKPENWIQIAAIIATLIVPWVSEWAKRLIANPADSQPNTLKNRIRRWIEGSTVIGKLNSLSLIINLGILAWQMFSTAPLSRYSVFLIAASVGNLYWLLTYRVLDDHAQSLLLTARLALETAQRQQDNTNTSHQLPVKNKETDTQA